jgi:serine/threonine protein kinase
MSIAAGSRIGPYEVVAALGAGAMGEVFRARDTRLHREVAIKILPPTYSRDPDRLRRFEQEARAAALLSHPNILAVHDVGVHDDAPYIVSELLEGETLRARLARSPFLPRKAIECALQIAHGLAAAHAKGVVHRDLKPENIFLTADGGAKILDFGIAKLKGHVVADGGAETAAIGTEPGVLLGTAGYMAPEQVRGEPADHRSDIFSLGAVLYEMIGGQRPFRGRSAVETMNAILTEEPRRLIELGPAVPPALDWLVARCLEKDPGDRFQSTQDLAISLEFAASPLPPGTARPGDRRLRRRAVAAALLAAAVLFAAGMFAARFVGRTSSVAAPSEPTQSRLYRLTDFVGLEEFPAVSPDGRSVAFTADVNGRRQIWIKLIGGGPPLQLTRDPVDHRFPRWSADSSALVYFTTPVEGGLAGSLWEISALGGAPRRLTASLGGAEVSPDGRRLALFRSAEGTVELVVADRDGSRPTVVARLEGGYVYRSPRWSPDGRTLAFERTYFGSRDRVFLTSLAGGSPREVTGEQHGPLGGIAWVPDGSAVVFSSARLSTISYLPTFHLWRMRLADGRVEQLTFDEASYTFPDIAPDGSILASRLRRRSDVWRFPTGGAGVANAARGVRVTNQTGLVRTPSVSPDDARLVYLSDAGGHSNLWVINLKTGETGQITFERDPALLIGVPMWSPRAPEIAFYSLPPGGIGG